MSVTFPATYYDSTGRFNEAIVFLSAVTITIRYTDENNEEKDVYWLVQDIISYEERAVETELKYRNKSGIVERLIARDQALQQALKKILKGHRVAGKSHHRVFGNILTKLAILSGIIIGLLMGIYLWLLPWLGDRMANNFSKQSEINIGNQLYESISSGYKTDSQKTKIINLFWQELHYRVDYPVQITVVESPEKNAFAIPGGHIVVYDAILDEMKTPEELAALLAHEVSHITHRHSLHSLFRSLARKMFLSLIVGNESGVASTIVDNADDLKELEYSRSLETEADNSGMRFMADNSIDPAGMLRLMEMLQKDTGPDEPNSFMSTHPIFVERMQNIKEQIAQLPPGSTDNSALKKTFHDIYEKGEW